MERIEARQAILASQVDTLLKMRAIDAEISQRHTEQLSALATASQCLPNTLSEEFARLGERLLAAFDDAARSSADRDAGIRDEMNRLRDSVARLIPPEAEFTERVIPFRQAPLDGIVSHLTQECGGHVADKGVMDISASTHYSNADRYRVRNIADFGGSVLMTDSRYFSVDEPNQWVEYDFKAARVAVTHYAIRTHLSCGAGSHHPKSWLVEVSNQRTGWVEIDRVSNSAELNRADYTVVFEVARADVEARWVRFRQTGLSHHGDNHFNFTRFELFGRLRTPRPLIP
jgi:hypothetical protein